MTPEPLRILTLVEAAALLGLHKSTLASLALASIVPGAKTGRAWRFIESDLVAYLRGQYKGEHTCPSTNKPAATSGGRTSPSLATRDYADQLASLIASRRKGSTTSSRRASGRSIPA